RDARGVRLVEDLGQDLRYAYRQCVANPSFTVATLLTLGLGIGASTVMYAFLKLTPIPFNDAERLVYVRQYSKKACPGCDNIASGNALALKNVSHSLESMALMGDGVRAAFRGREHTEAVRVQRVSWEFFRTVAVAPLVGRTFLPSDSLASQPPT